MRQIRQPLPPNIVVSFSGGHTSAYMSWLIKNASPSARFVFANTGKERNETLKFIHECDLSFGLNVTWIEYAEGGAGYSVVDYATADRSGNIFEAMIKKYGIPNQSYPHCSRELKIRPIAAWIRDNELSDYALAVGIRNDEIDRMSDSAADRNIFYPLIRHWPSTKRDVEDFWSKQKFSLGIKNYQGNCDWCWKKSDRKLLTIAQESPHIPLWWDKMEQLYGGFAPETQNRASYIASGGRVTFFRKNRSAGDVLELGSRPFRKYSADEYLQPEQRFFEFQEVDDLDKSGGCSESCEVF